MHGEQVHDALSQPQEEHAVVDAAGGLLKLAGRVVQEHEVEIRPVAELEAAELAVAGGRNLDDPRRAVVFSAARDPVHRGHLGPGEVHAALHDELRDVGKPIAHLHQRQPLGQVRKSHRERGDPLKDAQRLDLAFGIVRPQPLRARGQLAAESRARGQLIERLRIDQLVEQQGKIGDLARQKAADRAHVDEPIERRGLLLEQRQVG